MPKPELAEFADLILGGEVPDDKIADMAGVSVADVVAARAEAEPAVEEPPKKGGRPPKPKPAPPPEQEPDPEADKAEQAAAVDAQILKLAYAAQRKIEEGWELVDGELVRPAGLAAVPLVIRTKVKYDYVGKNKKGKDVNITLARSIYKGDMAHTVLGLVPSELVEVLSG